MYLRWVDNGIGKIWFLKSGLMSFIESRLHKGTLCRDVSFMGEDNRLFVSLVLMDDSDPVDKLNLSQDITEKLASMGIDAVISWRYWADEKEPDVPALIERPCFWGAVGSLLTALFILGLKNILICALAGALCYGISIFFLSEQARRTGAKWAKFIRERIN